MAGNLIEAQYGVVVRVPNGASDLEEFATFDPGYGRVDGITGFVTDSGRYDEWAIGRFTGPIHGSGQPAIYDYKPGGSLSDHSAARANQFAERMQAAEVNAVILRPGVNQNVLPYARALVAQEVSVIIAADMSARTRILSRSDAWEWFFGQAVALGDNAVKDFLVPGDDPLLVNAWCHLFDNAVGRGNYTLYAEPQRRVDLDLTLLRVPNLQTIALPNVGEQLLHDGSELLPLDFGYALSNHRPPL